MPPSADVAGQPFLAVDWGTTNLRAWAVDDEGRAGPMRELPLGVSKLAKGEAAACFKDQVRPALGAERLPAIICGMAGSNIGWVEVPYVDCPADARSLAAALKRVDGVDPPVWIVPGLRGDGIGGPDVMRGEETQLIGWLAEHRDRRLGRQVVCHPGTHAKWMLCQEGRLVRFVTAMTGELYSLLNEHSVLRSPAASFDAAGFDDGLRTAGEGDALAARLFTARARVVGGGGLRPEAVRSYLSGLLIGAEVASTPRLLGVRADTPIALLGDPALCELYRRALEHRGVEVGVHDGERAALLGLKALFEERGR